MTKMYEDYTIRKTAGVWQLETPLGSYPITVKLVGNGWSIPNIWSDGPARLSYDLVFEGRDNTYKVDVDPEDETINGVTVDGKAVNVIVIGCNFPVTKLFHAVTPEGTVPISERNSRL